MRFFPKKYLFININKQTTPTLIESGFNTECDLVISVISNADTRADRISERDSIGHDDAIRRIRAQKPDDFYKEHSDFVIFNDGNIECLADKAKKIYLWATDRGGFDS